MVMDGGVCGEVTKGGIVNGHGFPPKRMKAGGARILLLVTCPRLKNLGSPTLLPKGGAVAGAKGSMVYMGLLLSLRTG